MNVELEYASFQDFANRLWPCLSEQGMWVPFERSAGVGELVDFNVRLADGFRLFHGAGQVIGVGPGPRGASSGTGLTIRFSQLDEPSVNLIRKVVRKHEGEGGTPFVLSRPATKVEVVGDEYDGADSRSLGPEDLVAPFPDLEAEGEWAGGVEPELTSFLRPSGRKTQMELESDSGGLPDLDFRAGSPDPPEPPATEDSPTPDLDPQQELPVGADFESEPVPIDLEPAPAADREPETEPEPPPVTATEPEPAPETFSQLREELAKSVADTQAVPPMLLEEDLAEAVAPMAPFPPVDPDPRHSTVLPPGAAADESDTFDDDEFPDRTRVGSRWAKWLWALVALAVVVGGYFLVQRYLDRDSGSETVSARPAGGDAETPAVAGKAGGASSEAAPGAGEPAQESAPGTGDAVASADDAADDTPAPGPSSPGSTRGSTPPGEPAEDAAIVTAVAAAGAPGEGGAGETPVATASVGLGTALGSEPPPPGVEGGTVRLQRITWSERDGDTVIRLWLEGGVTRERLSTLRVVEGTPRLLLKIAGIEGAVPRAPSAIGSSHVSRLRFGVHPTAAGPELHVVADLTDEGVDMVGSLAVDADGVEWRVGRPVG